MNGAEDLHLTMAMEEVNLIKIIRNVQVFYLSDI